MEMWKHKYEVKKNRWVHVPTKEIYLFGKKLHKIIRRKWDAPGYYYHLREGGHVAAASIHMKNDFFSLIDIGNFFQSTSQSRVTRELKTLIPYVKAREAAKYSTVRIPNTSVKKFSLPYGFPQSPILSSLCLYNSYAGKVINDISENGDVLVSVYMDDIIISGKDFYLVSKAHEDIATALKKSRYDINVEKTQQVADRVIVFNLELAQNQLKVTPKRLVQFIQAYAKTENENEKKGIATYIHTVNPNQARLHFPKK
ncbi:reverse transcriptase domain-containing protein [Kalamiella sp. sgz302252]|uniref:reverse transcriptase domain-containing protein n=1 Tax=Pantoea sp. sgz302252 TaxID=3341827 RepID=UPI0036D3FCBB